MFIFQRLSSRERHASPDSGVDNVLKTHPGFVKTGFVEEDR
jgi:hypothetical protein